MTSTLVSQMTPKVASGIATIALKGPESSAIVLSALQFPAFHGRNGTKVENLVIGRIYYATWALSVPEFNRLATVTEDSQDLTSERLGKEQLVVCRPDSETVEVHCHGGKAICEALLACFERNGASIVSQVDWPDETQGTIEAAAVRALQSASTDQAAALLLAQLNGNLRRELQQVFELCADPSNSKIIECRLAKLCDHAVFGLKLADGWRIVLAGPPNSGKSSLINALLGQQKLIVHPQAGTTRDWTESHAVISGWPVRLTDTAGLRESSDAIEAEGIAKAKHLVEQSDLLLIIVDSLIGWQHEHQQLADSQSNHLVVWNKSDLIEQNGNDQRGIFASAIGIPGIEGLLDAISEAMFSNAPTPNDPVPFTSRQSARLREALEALKQDADLEAARAILAQMLEEEQE
ncbi:MAG: GTPase [Planctomycetota bacterium]